MAEAIDGILGAVDLLLDDQGAFTVRRREGGNVGEKFRIAEDGGERIANFVGGAGRDEIRAGGGAPAPCRRPAGMVGRDAGASTALPRS